VADFDTRHPEIPLVAQKKAENTVGSKNETTSTQNKTDEVRTFLRLFLLLTLFGKVDDDYDDYYYYYLCRFSQRC